MGFLLPSSLAFAALAIPIIIFYMLKLRRQPARVSSLMLWQQVIQDRQANAPWQRIKRNILLLLQLLILALLVMALARPYFEVEARVQGNVVILLDASASMQATDVAPSRFGAAQAAARDLINRLSAADVVTLIAVESTPRVLAAATSDRAVLRQNLNTAQASNGPADWEAALTLAAANAATLPDATVVIISDGGLPTEQLGALSALPGSVEFIPIGQTSDNQGVVALSLRDANQGPELFARVANAAEEPARRLLEVKVDGQLFDARWVDLSAGESQGLTFNGLPLNTQRVQATLNEGDILAADDSAWVVRSTAPNRILVVGQGNLFLERALALLPGTSMQRAAIDQPLPDSPFDLVIFDRTDLGQFATEDRPLPEGNLLFIAPPASTPLFEVTGTMTQTQLAYIASDDPRLNYVKLNTMRVGQAQAVTPPPWGTTLVGADGGPLLLTGQVDKRRVAIFTFDLHQSDLPLQIDFPILMVNLAHWLLPGASSAGIMTQSLQANQSINLPSAANADALLIITPDQQELRVPSDQSTFNETTDLGIYQIFAQNTEAGEAELLTEFTVNLLAEDETHLAPQSINLGQVTAPEEDAPPLTGQQEWWWILVVLGLGVLLIEWWVYWRGEVR